MYLLEIDQVPEENRVFVTVSEVIDYAIQDKLNGHYTHNMTLEQLTDELSKNGYYLSSLG